MALAIAITSPSNVAAGYVRISSVSNAPLLNYAAPFPLETTINVELWKDEPTRRDGQFTPVAIKNYKLPAVLASLTDAYSYLKTLPEFDGATDC